MGTNMVSWFELPVVDMDRAKQFYETVFQIQITIHDLDGLIMGWFPPPQSADSYGTTGTLVKHEEYIPSNKQGALIYFNSQSGDIANELSRVEEAGGTIVRGKTLISAESGYMAVIIDSEGNRVALFHK